MNDRLLARDSDADGSRTSVALRFLLVAAVVFGAVFTLVYRAATRAPGSPAAAASAALASRAAAAERLSDLARDPRVVTSGAEVYRTTCAVCHGTAGRGLTGPDLTDRVWLHGERPETILAGVLDGYPGKGMPGWEPVLGLERSAHAAAYVLTLRRTGDAQRAPATASPPEPALAVTE